MRSARAEVAFRRESALGEGAYWDDRRGCLYWVDILGHRVMRFDPEAGSNREYDVGQPVGTVVATHRKELVIALRHAVATLDPETERIEALVELEAEPPDNRLNDGKCDPQGRLWVGSMGEDDAPTGSLYRVARTAGAVSLTRHLSGVGISNGLVWSGDSTRFYYIDTSTQQVRVFDFDLEAGRIANPRVVYTCPTSLGSPDGMAIDDEDHLWVALWGGHQVVRVDPERGAIVFRVEVAARNVTSCAFGGPDLDQLYITTARVGLSPEQLDAEPDTGSLFCVQLPFRGRAAARFAL